MKNINNEFNVSLIKSLLPTYGYKKCCNASQIINKRYDFIYF